MTTRSPITGWYVSRITGGSSRSGERFAPVRETRRMAATMNRARATAHPAGTAHSAIRLAVASGSGTGTGAGAAATGAALTVSVSARSVDTARYGLTTPA